MSAGARLEFIAVEKIPAIRPGDDLAAIVLGALEAMEAVRLRDGDIVAVAQKVVSKSENRYVALEGIAPSARAVELAARCDKDPRLVQVILAESRQVLRVAPGVLVVEDNRGLVLANAGVDRSNVDQEGAGERVLLLPEDPDASAARLRARIAELAGVDVGVIVNDSLGRAWRLGTVGAAIGVSGMPALLDRRGERDLQGRELKITVVGYADELAAAASAVMGQAAEGTPFVIVRGAAWPRRDGNARELLRPAAQDLFR